ncbi:cytochrome C oxidase polypeptide III [Listeria monocytogenes str. 4b H7858]|nr:cytochrome C oxidase polypeptide III [Listeria monocytogenes str. 4b H7858] [Listeria monocytogenes serotype 4b str. H7858]
MISFFHYFFSSFPIRIPTLYFICFIVNQSNCFFFFNHAIYNTLDKYTFVYINFFV